MSGPEFASLKADLALLSAKVDKVSADIALLSAALLVHVQDPGAHGRAPA